MASNIKKRRRMKASHRWSDIEVKTLLERISAHLDDDRNEGFEKPTNRKFYQAISAGSKCLQRIDWKVMKSKMRYLKGTYMSVRKLKNETGNLLTENGEYTNPMDHAIKYCQHFELLHKIFADHVDNNVGYKREEDASTHANSFEFCEANDEETSSYSNDDSSDFETMMSANQLQVNTTDTDARKTSTLKRRADTLQSEELAAAEDSVASTFELKRLELEMKKEESLIELKKLDLEKQFEIRKLVIEKEERLEIRKMEIEREERLEKLKIESEEKIKMFEIQIKYKRES